MTTFTEIVDAAEEAGISLADVDTVYIDATSYKDWQEKMEQVGSVAQTSDYATVEGPAVRQTDGQPRMVYVDEQGYEQAVEL